MTGKGLHFLSQLDEAFESGIWELYLPERFFGYRHFKHIAQDDDLTFISFADQKEPYFVHPDDRFRLLKSIESYLSGKLKNLNIQVRLKTLENRWQYFLLNGRLLEKTSENIRIGGIFWEQIAEEPIKEKIEYRIGSQIDFFQLTPIALIEQDLTDFIKVVGALDAKVYDRQQVLKWEKDFLDSLYAFIKIIRLNQSALELFKISSVEEYIKNQDHFFLENKSEIVWRLLYFMQEGNRYFEIESKFNDNENQEHIALIRYMLPIIQNPNERVSIIIAIQDITQIKTAEMSILSYTELLQKKNLDLDDFIHSVSHDLKEPVRCIANSIQFALEDYRKTLPLDLVEMLDKIRQLSLKMTNLIETLLKYARLGKKGLENKFIETQWLITEIIQELKINNKNVKFSFFWPQEKIYLRGDNILLYELFMNIIVNAVKYNDKQKKEVKIFIKPEIPTKTILVSISDNGIGIEQRNFDRIFQIFRRLHGEGEFGGGHGAGLAIVKKIVDIHSGEIWLESKLGEGSSFNIRLPGTMKEENHS